jgi:hypothetical protein
MAPQQDVERTRSNHEGSRQTRSPSRGTTAGRTISTAIRIAGPIILPMISDRVTKARRPRGHDQAAKRNTLPIRTVRWMTLARRLSPW